MFQFRRFPTYDYLIHHTLPCGGFPHSEISGSQLICSSPKLIAAYHVLHRLLMPRHSPCALSRLTFFGPITCSRYCRIMQAPRRQMLRSFASAVPLSRSVQSSSLRSASSRIQTRLRWALNPAGFFTSNKIVIYPNC